MLILALATAMAFQEPEPQTLYHQAVGCAASAVVDRGEQPPPETRGMDEEILTWGLVMADFGPRAGRTVAQVDHEDVEKAHAFFTQMQTSKPASFEAHRAFCRSFLP